MSNLRVAPRTILVLIAASLVPTVASAESWTDLSGTRTVEARMVGLWKDTLILQMQNGRRITVKLDDLEATSRIKAQNMARDQARVRGEVIGELQGQAKEAAAPAPNPLPMPPAAPSYIPPTLGSDCVTQLNWMQNQSVSGHQLRAFFDVMPPSYQKDVDDLLKLAAAKIDPAGWNNLIGSVHKLGDLIVTRQRWLFSHPKINALPASTHDKIKNLLLNAGGLLRVGLDPQKLNPQTMQSMPAKELIGQLSDSIAPYAAELSRQIPMTQSFELASEKDGMANIKVTMGEDSFEVPYMQVEGVWVPAEMVGSWGQRITDAKAALTNAPNGTILSGGIVAMVPMMINQNVSPLAAAQNRNDFHAAMEPLFAQVQPVVSSMGLLADTNAGGRGRGGQNQFDEYDQGGDDYDEMMEEDMEMEMEMEQGMDDEYEREMQDGRGQN